MSRCGWAREHAAQRDSTAPGGDDDPLDDARLARRLADSAGRVLLELRRDQPDLEPSRLKAAGDLRSQEHLAAQLPAPPAGGPVLSEEGDTARTTWSEDATTRPFGWTPTGSGSSTRSTAPGSSASPAATDWAVHVGAVGATAS